MTPIAEPTPGRTLRSRVWTPLTAAWGTVIGLAPHVLHHVGPLAGAALLAGFGGKTLFFVVGLALSVPLLRRLYRRFGTLLAPGAAVVLFAAMFALSSWVIGPAVVGDDTKPAPGLEQPEGHDTHHDQ